MYDSHSPTYSFLSYGRNYSSLHLFVFYGEVPVYIYVVFSSIYTEIFTPWSLLWLTLFTVRHPPTIFFPNPEITPPPPTPPPPIPAFIQVVCGPCNSYSGHLYERLGSELGTPDGMTMKTEFCNDLVTACTGQMEFPTYDGVSYCDKHVGDQGDQLWSYPIDPSGERERFCAGENEVHTHKTSIYIGSIIWIHTYCF